VIKSIEFKRNPSGRGWQVFFDGVDITDHVNGWRVEPASGKPDSFPIVWLGFVPSEFDMSWSHKTGEPQFGTKNEPEEGRL
jgi:hypothetical protein